MSYKTIVVHVDHSEHAPQRMRLAAELALAEGAHLVGAAANPLPPFRQDYGFHMARRPEPAPASGARDDPLAALAGFDALARRIGVTSHEQCLLDNDPVTALTERARYSDLVVLSQGDPELAPASSVGGPGLAEAVMLNSLRPVLMIPYAGRFNHLGLIVLVAWDGSAEAGRAISGALPILRRAHQVCIVVFNGAQTGRHPGADMALFLVRHGVRVEVLEKEVDIDTGNALLSLAAERDADLIVMGGYRHSRVREALLGGTTRTVLATMTVPVLMSH